jgi:quercetin dioxygenase-like cupin family protein
LSKPQAERAIVDFPWGRIVWLASGAQGNADALTLGHVTIRQGAQNDSHRHPNCEEILHLLQGRLEHVLEDSVFPMEPGDTLTIPQGQWHYARSVGDEDAVMLVCYSSANRQTEMRD